MPDMQLLFVCFVCFVFLCVSSADRESEIGDRKVESWIIGNLKIVVFVFDFLNDCDDFYRFLRKCYDLTKVLHAFDKILIF